MREILLNSIAQCIQAAEYLERPDSLEFIEQATLMIADAFRNGNKILIAGNGGSLCDAAHFAEELTGIFRQFRPALPAIALNEPGHLTCVGNDLGFEWVFARAVQALGKPNDIFIGLTTSGNSANLIRAFESAKLSGLKTIAFLGRGGGKLKGVADIEIIVNGFATSDRVQETHMAAIHIIIELIELQLFSKSLESQTAKEAIPAL